jgi:hypothetical protein
MFVVGSQPLAANALQMLCKLHAFAELILDLSDTYASARLCHWLCHRHRRIIVSIDVFCFLTELCGNFARSLGAI